jgi:peptide/nickel transport system ATP-binding protein
MNQPILQVKDLSLFYLTRFNEKVRAVEGVSFDLRQGQILGIAGESGCGKSTLVNGCMGLTIPPLFVESGDVSIDGSTILGMSIEENRKEVLGKKICMIPQGALNSLNPTRKIKDLATDMVFSHLDASGGYLEGGGASSTHGHKKKEIAERLRERFSKIGLDADKVLNAYPVELPAGTKQRVVIGISTLLNPRVVIADEPTSALDVSTQKAVIKLLFDLMESEIIGSMIFITHELPLLRHVASHIAIMYAGQFVEVGTTDQVVFDSRHPYTKALMGAMLSAEIGQRDRKPVYLEGAPPNLKNPIQGCRFAERCPSVRSNCKTIYPQLRLLAERMVRCTYAT